MPILGLRGVLLIPRLRLGMHVVRALPGLVSIESCLDEH